MSDGAYLKFEKAIYELDPRFVVENDGAKCTVRFPGSAYTPTLNFSRDLTEGGLEDLFLNVRANMMHKNQKMPHEVAEWFGEMDHAGVRLASHATSITHYFSHKSGELKEFSYERALLKPEYRRELLEWANQAY